MFIGTQLIFRPLFHTVLFRFFLFCVCLSFGDCSMFLCLLSRPLSQLNFCFCLYLPSCPSFLPSFCLFIIPFMSHSLSRSDTILFLPYINTCFFLPVYRFSSPPFITIAYPNLLSFIPFKYKRPIPALTVL